MTDLILKQILDWYNNPDSQFITINGAGGTGKTTICANLIKTLDLPEGEVSLCAPTNEAKFVLYDSVFQQTNLRCEARTIASLLAKTAWVNYKTKRLTFGAKPTKDEDYNTFNRNPANILLIVDEAYMASTFDIAKILSLGHKTIFLGDSKQLPPIGGKSPEEFFRTKGEIITLTKVHRQDGDLLQACNLFREKTISDIFNIEKKLKGNSKVKVIVAENEGNIIPELPKDIIGNWTILSFTNKQVIYNNLTLHGESGKVKVGQELIANGSCFDSMGNESILDFYLEVRLNYSDLVKNPSARNGNRLKVIKASKVLEETIDSTSISDYITPDDPITIEYQEVILETASGARFTTLIPNYAKPNVFDIIREKSVNEMAKAVELGKVDQKDHDGKIWNKDNMALFAFVGANLRPSTCMTVNKAQGKTIKKVIVDLTRMPSTNTYNWIYTAVSRASEELIIIG